MSESWEPTVMQRLFVAALAKMVAPMQAAEAGAAIMPMLAAPEIRRLPLSLFDRPAELALDIGSDMERVPTLARLQKALTIWHQLHVPNTLPGNDLGLPPADRLMVEYWKQYRSGEKKFEPGSGVNFKVWLSMIRSPAPAAFAHLTQTDNLAAEIAVKAGWQTGKQQGGPSEEEQAYVHKRVQDCLGAGSRSYDAPKSTIAPDAMDQHVPPQPLPASVVDAFEEKHGRKPGQLSPEQLEAVRQRANGPRAPANDPKPPKSNMEPTNFFEL